jgi:hypothetical protein
MLTDQKVLEEKKDDESKIGTGRLWANILSNLEREPLNKIQLSLTRTTESLRSQVSQRLNRASATFFHRCSDANRLADTVAFTCGHDYARQHFVDVLVPELRARLKAFPTPIPVTAALLQQEYFLVWRCVSMPN